METGALGHLQQGPTAGRPTYKLIQALRAMAALMVVVHHSTLLLHDRNGLAVGNWVNGGAGVDIFFVISGFVMTISSAPLRASRHAARIFLARRLERIVPMYWLATAVKLALLLAVPSLALNALGTPWHVIASFLFLPSRNPEGHFDPVLVVGWTLNFEMAFYVLFACALALRAPLLKFVAPILIAIALLPLAGPRLSALGAAGFYTNSIVTEFLLGILLALNLKHIQKLPHVVAWPLALAAFYVLCTWVYPNFSPWRGLLWGVAATAVVASALALEPRFGNATPRWLLTLGDASYAIYLLHGFALPLVGVALAHLGTHWPAVVPASILIATALSTLCGVAAYRLIERPIAQHFKGRRRTAVPTTA